MAEGGSKPDEVLESIKRQDRQNALAIWRTPLNEERYALAGIDALLAQYGRSLKPACSDE